MAHTRSWDTADPADTDSAQYGAQEIRELKVDIEERLEGFFNDINDDPLVLKTGYAPNVKGDPAALTFEDTGETTPAGKFRALSDSDKLTLQGRNSTDDGWDAMLDLDRTNRRVAVVAGCDYKGLGTVRVRNLVSYNNTTNPLYQVDVNADEALLADGDGDLIRIGTIDLTLDLTASGANGLDAGSEAADTWYYVWVIAKKSDGTTAGLLSTSASSPTLPTDYTHKALVGAVRNNASSNLLLFIQWGKQVWLRETITNRRILNNGTATTYTQIGVTANAIPVAVALTGVFTGFESVGDAKHIYLSYDGTNDFSYAGPVKTVNQITMPVPTGGIFYKVTSGGGGFIYVDGWTLRDIF